MIPAWQADRTLPFVLAGLAAQTYPAHLLEVVVADDGSTPPVELPAVRPENTRIVRIERGWGQANALRTGIEATDGDVLLRLDADMLAYREHVEAHLRWHHLVDYAVVLGHKVFVDGDAFSGVGPEVLHDAVRSGSAPEELARGDVQPHAWIEEIFEVTESLAAAGPRALGGWQARSLRPT